MKILSLVGELTIPSTNKFAILAGEMLNLKTTLKSEVWVFDLCMLEYAEVSRAKF